MALGARPAPAYMYAVVNRLDVGLESGANLGPGAESLQGADCLRALDVDHRGLGHDSVLRGIRIPIRRLLCQPVRSSLSRCPHCHRIQLHRL